MEPISVSIMIFKFKGSYTIACKDQRLKLNTSCRLKQHSPSTCTHMALNAAPPHQVKCCTPFLDDLCRDVGWQALLVRWVFFFNLMHLLLIAREN